MSGAGHTTSATLGPPALREPAVSPLETARLVALHSLCFVLPLSTLGFLLSTPSCWRSSRCRS
jgi:hypothetical protein